jgi:hypothetical protein
MRDPSLNHRFEVDRITKTIEAMKTANPTDYWTDTEYRHLLDVKQLHLMRLRQIERMKKQGVKF